MDITKKELLIKQQIASIINSMIEAGSGFGLTDLPQNHSLLLVIRELAKTQLELAEVKKEMKNMASGIGRAMRSR